MPILPYLGTPPLDSVEAALILARVRINDAIASTSGEVMTDNAAFTQTAVNGAWRVAQSFLGNLGYNDLISETVLTACPTVASTDPAVQTSVNWNGFFDGASYFPTPALPQNLLQPLKMWERQTGMNQCFPNQPNMECMLDGLPAWPKQWRNFCWEWREQAIWMPGSQYSMDLRIRYIKYLGDFLTVGDPPTNGTYWYNQLIPLVWALSPFSKFIAYEVCQARGDVDASVFKAEGEQEFREMFNRNVRMKQRVNVRRQPRSLRGGNSSNSYGCNYGLN